MENKRLEAALKGLHEWSLKHKAYITAQGNVVTVGIDRCNLDTHAVELVECDGMCGYFVLDRFVFKQTYTWGSVEMPEGLLPQTDGSQATEDKE